MTENELKSRCREIFLLLTANKLKSAFSKLRMLAAETGKGSAADEADDLEQTYRYIITYTVNGVDDPERGRIYNHLVASAFELTDRMYENWMSKYSQTYLYRKKRSLNSFDAEQSADLPDILEIFQNQEDPGDISEFRRQDDRPLQESWQRIIQIFWHIVFMDKCTGSEKTFISVIMGNEIVIPEIKSLFITALTFSNLRFFNEEKMAFLLDLYKKMPETEMVKQRCLTGYLLALYQYDDRLMFYPESMARLESEIEDPAFIRYSGKIMLQLLLTRETEKIRQKFRDEILPEMIRITPNLRNKLNFENLMDEGIPDDRNPDWQEIFSESPGLLDKVEELTRMQMEGADVFLSSFAMFKSFPFFNEFTNWFIPFYPGHPDVIQLTSDDQHGDQARLTGSLLFAPLLCSSDKYSFLFMLQSLSGEARAMMTQFLRNDLKQMDEITKDEELLDPGREGEIVSNGYIQDLYRFYRLHPSRNDFDDIFNWKFDFHHKTGFSIITGKDPELIYKMAEFCFEKGYFRDALDLYEHLNDQRAETLQKEAYCHEKLGNFEKALSLYRKAELFDVNRIWNRKKIALCYRNLKQPEEALKVYQSILSVDPDNLKIIYATGYCFSEIRQYPEALKCFFKIEYLSPGNKKIWKPVAWFSFVTGKKEQAEEYYRRLMDDYPDKYDLMNMGHVQWASGKRRSALEYYRQSLVTGGFSGQDFMTAFNEDLPVLLAQGIHQEEIPIMLDQLWYSLEE